MTKNKRYETQVDAQQDARRAAVRPSPVTLPLSAWGPEPFEWFSGDKKRDVWVWIQWRDGPAERLPAVATGANDRVVCVEFIHVGGTRNTMVWRQACTVRETPKAPPHPPGEG